MKAIEVRKKMELIKHLLSEYGSLQALIKHMEQDKQNSPPVNYLGNCKKRLAKIEDMFDNLLK